MDKSIWETRQKKKKKRNNAFIKVARVVFKTTYSILGKFWDVQKKKKKIAQRAKIPFRVVLAKRQLILGYIIVISL